MCSKRQNGNRGGGVSSEFFCGGRHACKYHLPNINRKVSVMLLKNHWIDITNAVIVFCLYDIISISAAFVKCMYVLCHIDH